MRNGKTWTVLALGSVVAFATFGAVGGGVAAAQAEPQASQHDQGTRAGQAGECRPSSEAQVAEVLRELHMMNQDEIALGKVADERAEAPEIKSFGARMVKDHSNADKALTELAKRQGLDLEVEPTNPIAKALRQADEAHERRLRDAHGARFDIEYIAPSATEHELGLQIVDVGLENATDEVKPLLDSMHGMLSAHLALARRLGSQLVLRPSLVGGGPSGQRAVKPPRAEPKAAPPGQAEPKPASPQQVEPKPAPSEHAEPKPAPPQGAPPAK